MTTVARSPILTTKSKGKLYVKAIDGGQKRFLASIRTNIRALWLGPEFGGWDLPDFLNAMRRSIDVAYRRAWRVAAEGCGLLPEDMTQDEQLFLDRRIAEDILRSDNLALDVWDGRKANGGKLYSFYPRANLWANNYNEISNLAKVSSCGDKKQEWVISAKESCPSCLKLSGKVKRASYWLDNDVHPQHRSKLECMIGAGGVPVCKCSLRDTEKPVTRGPLPRLP
jgi:hypothetical protein